MTPSSAQRLPALRGGKTPSFFPLAAALARPVGPAVLLLLIGQADGNGLLPQISGLLRTTPATTAGLGAAWTPAGAGLTYELLRRMAGEAVVAMPSIEVSGVVLAFFFRPERLLAEAAATATVRGFPVF